VPKMITIALEGSAPHIREIIAKKTSSFNSSVMDDNHDTNKTANIKINQLF
jgi:hypothetical protein